jgi:hypothetical protein
MSLTGPIVFIMSDRVPASSSEYIGPAPLKFIEKIHILLKLGTNIGHFTQRPKRV